MNFRRLPLVVFYDGGCATCHFLVKFLLRRRHRQAFAFVPLEQLKKDFSAAQLAQAGVGNPDKSIVVVQNGRALVRSNAVFAILKELGFPWTLLGIFQIVPMFVRNLFYNLYATNRYAIAGRANPEALCQLPSPQQLAQLFQKPPEPFSLFEKRSGEFLSAQWLNLLIVNYVVPPELLKPLVPAGTELDLYQGQAFCSMVGFVFANTFVLGMRIPFHTQFEEINLRFYVKRRELEDGKEVWKRGVVFVKELVPRFAIAFVAKTFYNENYEAVPMASTFNFSGTQGSVSYEWNSAPETCTLGGTFEGDLTLVAPGSLDELITEHSFVYVRQQDGSTMEYNVEHPRWRTWKSARGKLSGPVEKTYGAEFARYLKIPHSTCMAEGSAVRVFAGKKLIARP